MGKKVIVISLTLFTVILIIIGLFFGHLWIITNGDTHKFVKDEYDNKILIEYFNIDTNELRLEIKENGKSFWINHPECCMKVSSHIPSNDIKFSRDKDNVLIVNGEEFEITEQN